MEDTVPLVSLGRPPARVSEQRGEASFVEAGRSYADETLDMTNTGRVKMWLNRGLPPFKTTHKNTAFDSQPSDEQPLLAESVGTLDSAEQIDFSAAKLIVEKSESTYNFVKQEKNRVGYLRRMMNKAQKLMAKSEQEPFGETSRHLAKTLLNACDTACYEKLEEGLELKTIPENPLLYQLETTNKFAALSVDINEDIETASSAPSVNPDATGGSGDHDTRSGRKLNRKRRFPEVKLANIDDVENEHYAEDEDRPVYHPHPITVQPAKLPYRYNKKYNKVSVGEDLYQFLLAEALFLPRKPGLFRQLKLKAKQYWAKFDMSDYTQAYITKETAAAISAAMIPSEFEVQAMRKMSHSRTQELICCWNNFLEDLKPMGALDRFGRYIRNQVGDLLEGTENVISEAIAENMTLYEQEFANKTPSELQKRLLKT